MGSHPLNLALRFILEIAALFAFGYWGWTQHEGVWRYIWAAGLVIGAAVTWGTGGGVTGCPPNEGQFLTLRSREGLNQHVDVDAIIVARGGGFHRHRGGGWTGVGHSHGGRYGAGHPRGRAAAHL